ncbi:MAG: ABC transporter ATP-binding protein [Nitrospirae bacterium]|jgi:cobalt/nickel transport system ATP-binding protein|nr:ABC transporter ATP-binding protein [Nitrospirota bacterium]
MSHHIVELKDAFFKYPDGTEALKGVSFKILHGESVGIAGANGMGKTTLLLNLSGHLIPTKGEVSIGEVTLCQKTRQEIRRKVGFVFQRTDDQLFMPTVYEDVAFGPVNLGLPENKVNERVKNALEMVGCYHLKDRPPHRLSEGQKRAVAIATVIAMEPDILIMDEPASNLDPRSRRQLINLLNKFKHTKIIASHDLDLILDVCERCIIIRDGKVFADGPSDEILLNESLLEENGLELPLTRQLHNFKQSS